jgi:hypothetical protein
MLLIDLAKNIDPNHIGNLVIENTCALSKHIGKYVYSARNAGKSSAKPRLFPRQEKENITITTVKRDKSYIGMNPNIKIFIEITTTYSEVILVSYK